MTRKERAEIADELVARMVSDGWGASTAGMVIKHWVADPSGFTTASEARAVRRVLREARAAADGHAR